MQSRTYSIACDCKSPKCTWHISCLITFQATQSGYPKNDFRFFNRILPYNSLLRMPTLIPCPSLGNDISHNNYHCAKNFRSKSHPQVKDTVRSKLLSTYKRGIRLYCYHYLSNIPCLPLFQVDEVCIRGLVTPSIILH